MKTSSSLTKKLYGLSTALILSAVSSVYGVVPILSYDFNTPGATQTSSGSEALVLNFERTDEGEYLTGEGTGVSGASHDLAFGVGTYSTRPYGTATIGTESALRNIGSTLNGFTVTGWYKGAPAADGRVFSFNSGNAGGRVQVYFNGLDNNRKLRVQIGTTTDSQALTSAAESYVNSPDEWMFFAVTYNFDTGVAGFYVGSETETVGLVSFSTQDAGKMLKPTHPATVFFLGDVWDRNRSLAADLDNFKFYGEVLDLSNLQTVRTGDLQIPEAQHGTLLLGAGVIAWMLYRHRRAALS